MCRTQFFEILDQPWCPRFLRTMLTEYLEYATSATRGDPFGQGA